MHVLLIGATGRTGRIILADLLARSHTVVALVRDPSSLPADPSLETIRGSPLHPEDTETAFTYSSKPIDAVIVALAAPLASGNPFSAPVSPPRLMADSHKNLVAEMKRHGVYRIITMAAFGAGSSWPNLNVVMKGVFCGTNMKYQMEDHNAVNQEMQSVQGLAWTAVRPSLLVGEGVRKVRVMGNEGKGVGAFDKISRESVARFMTEDCLESGKYKGQTPVIVN